MTENETKPPADEGRLGRRVRRQCSHCGMPLPASDSGLRHYGLHTAHQEHECLRLLHAEIGRLREVLVLTIPALELGLDALRAEATSYHAAMKGYRPTEHAKRDAVSTAVELALRAVVATLTPNDANERRR